MSVDITRPAIVIRTAVLWALIGSGGIVIADDADAPDIEFLEYLGSWEASEEDWVLLVPDEMAEEADKESGRESVDPPGGEKLAERNDES
jgi:hypothetical protein